jgi:hypothetical protein
MTPPPSGLVRGVNYFEAKTNSGARITVTNFVHKLDQSGAGTGNGLLIFECREAKTGEDTSLRIGQTASLRVSGPVTRMDEHMGAVWDVQNFGAKPKVGGFTGFTKIFSGRDAGNLLAVVLPRRLCAHALRAAGQEHPAKCAVKAVVNPNDDDIFLVHSCSLFGRNREWLCF